VVVVLAVEHRARGGENRQLPDVSAHRFFTNPPTLVVLSGWAKASPSPFQYAKAAIVGTIPEIRFQNTAIIISYGGGRA
jgi:hypothetical protein